jgi:hypothetical protein
VTDFKTLKSDEGSRSDRRGGNRVCLAAHLHELLSKAYMLPTEAEKTSSKMFS